MLYCLRNNFQKNMRPGWVAIFLSMSFLLSACGQQENPNLLENTNLNSENEMQNMSYFYEDGVPTSQEMRNSLYGELVENRDASRDNMDDETNDNLDSFAGNQAVWASVSGTQSWTNATLSVIKNRMSSFEKARDRNVFCPGYDNATQEKKQLCWLRLVSAVARFESAFHPGDSFREPNGKYSVGLLALSTGECSNAPTLSALKNPVKNLICGTNKMAHLIARDGYIDGPSNNRGAASYWSVLRKPYSFRKMKLGKKYEIIPLTKIYRSL